MILSTYIQRLNLDQKIELFSSFTGYLIHRVDADPMAILAFVERLGEREFDLVYADFDDDLLDVSLAKVDKMLVGLNPFKMHEHITCSV